MKKITTKEREFRCKIIAENHLKKDAQKYIDFYVAENRSHSINLTYKRLYLDDGLLHSILVKYNLSKLSNALKDVGASCVKAANTLKQAMATFNKLTTL